MLDGKKHKNYKERRKMDVERQEECTDFDEDTPF